MRIAHHGAVTGVTGSCHELWVDDARSVLIDCGLFQGAETSGTGASAERLAIEFDLGAVRAVLVTHGHLDHVGRLPSLLAAGFQGPIYCSESDARRSCCTTWSRSSGRPGRRTALRAGRGCGGRTWISWWTRRWPVA